MVYIFSFWTCHLAKSMFFDLAPGSLGKRLDEPLLWPQHPTIWNNESIFGYDFLFRRNIAQKPTIGDVLRFDISIYILVLFEFGVIEHTNILIKASSVLSLLGFLMYPPLFPLLSTDVDPNKLPPLQPGNFLQVATGCEPRSKSKPVWISTSWTLQLRWVDWRNNVAGSVFLVEEKSIQTNHKRGCVLSHQIDEGQALFPTIQVTNFIIYHSLSDGIVGSILLKIPLTQKRFKNITNLQVLRRCWYL